MSDITINEAQMSVVIVLRMCTNSALEHPRNLSYSAEHVVYA